MQYNLLLFNTGVTIENKEIDNQNIFSFFSFEKEDTIKVIQTRLNDVYL